MQHSAWARELTASRWSRAAYGALKAICFCALGILIAWQMAAPAAAALPIAQNVVRGLVFATVAFSIVQAVPVIWDGRRFLSTAASRDVA